jgi:hypothetical protein
MKTLHLNRAEAKQWTRAQRNQYTANNELREASIADFKKLCANAGISPDEAYREMEDRTVVEPNPAGEFATWARINQVSKAVSLGKLDYTYRQASTQTGGVVSMSGQTGIITDAIQYKNAGTVIPIIDHGSKRDWREMLTFGADGFDTMVDDMREAELVLMRTANDYLWSGNASIVSPEGRSWLGLKADPSLVQATSSVNFQTATGATIVEEIGTKVDTLRITNNCDGLVELSVPQATLSYWSRTPYSTAEPSYGTILEHVRGINGIASVYEDPAMTGVSEFLLAKIDIDGLHAVTGQALSTYMKERVMHNDPFIMVKWMAQGFVAKQSYSGKKTALYCKAA